MTRNAALRRRTFLAGLTLLCAAAGSPALGNGFTYQGRLKQSGAPVTGNVAMTFRLYDAATSPPGAQIGASITLPVVAVDDGLFTVALNSGGEFGPAAFNGGARWLEVVVDGTPLSPRQQVTATPYALFATAPWSSDGSGLYYNAAAVRIGTSATYSGTRMVVAQSGAAGLNLRLEKPEGGQMLQLSDAVNYASYLSLDAAGDFSWFGESPTSGVLVRGGNVGVGLTNPAAKLEVLPTPAGRASEAIRASNNGDALVFGHTNSNYRSSLGAFNNSGAPYLFFHGEHSAVSDNAIQRDGLGAAPIGFMHNNADALLVMSSPAGAPNSDAALGTIMSLNAAGTVGVGTQAPGGHMLNVLSARGASGESAIKATAAVGGALTNTEFAALANRGSGTWWAAYAKQGSSAAAGYFEGRVGVNAPVPVSPLVVGGAINPPYRGNVAGHLLVQDQVAGGRATIDFSDSAGSVKARLAAEITAGGSYLRLGTSNSYTTGITNDALTISPAGYIGIGTTTPQTALDVLGTTRTQVLEIYGGADVAEGYDIGPADGVEPRPGMVVVIDAGHVGRLRVCDQAYDRGVAGVVSGANGVRPGLVLGQRGSVADGALPVANVGRVWCWVDADAGGPVRPGALLTSSCTPGHAMCVSNPVRSQGAVLGKAMSGLERGRGLVLVLVSLQ